MARPGRARRIGLVAAAVVVGLPLAGLLALRCVPVSWGVAALLHPGRVSLGAAPDLPFERVEIRGEGGVPLVGWLFRTAAPRRGLVVYLHGIGDNRAGGAGIAHRLGPEGWDVLAYDSRAHGESGGAAATYGFFERHDLARALDALGAPRAVLLGASMGAAVALQAAAIEPRVAGVIAAAPFADLRTIVHDRAPWLATEGQIEGVLRGAEAESGLRVDEVSPVAAAPRIRVPVLLIHGTEDTAIRPEHTRRIHEALVCPKRLLMVEGAGHNDLLGREEAWSAIVEWLRALG